MEKLGKMWTHPVEVGEKSVSHEHFMETVQIRFKFKTFEFNTSKAPLNDRVKHCPTLFYKTVLYGVAKRVQQRKEMFYKTV